MDSAIVTMLLAGYLRQIRLLQLALGAVLFGWGFSIGVLLLLR